MKKIIIFICIATFAFSFWGCKPNLENQPIDFPGSKWVSKNPPAEFVVDSKNPLLLLTLNGEKKEYVLSFDENWSNVVLICERNTESAQRYDLSNALTVGRGTFKPNKFTFKITNDISGLLEGYDKIVFYRDFEYEK